MTTAAPARIPHFAVRIGTWLLIVALTGVAVMASYVWHREVGARETVAKDQKSDHEVLIEVRTDVRHISESMRSLLDHERRHHHQED